MKLNPFRFIYKLISKIRLKIWVHKYKSFFYQKRGLEIGGPTIMFKKHKLLPLYTLCKSLDGCNFSSNTIWEGQINKAYVYEEGKPSGHQYICEADNLSIIPDEEYDFILSCHSLEHIANPIKALLEWKRVLKPGGKLCIIVPDKTYTFDHKREYTTFSHLVEDYKNKKDETDLTHLEEILELHDLTKDAGVDGEEKFKARSIANFENRCLHHHVYDLQLLKEVTSYCKMTPISSFSFPPFNNLILVSK